MFVLILLKDQFSGTMHKIAKSCLAWEWEFKDLVYNVFLTSIYILEQIVYMFFGFFLNLSIYVPRI